MNTQQISQEQIESNRISEWEIETAKQISEFVKDNKEANIDIFLMKDGTLRFEQYDYLNEKCLYRTFIYGGATDGDIMSVACNLSWYYFETLK